MKRTHAALAACALAAGCFSDYIVAPRPNLEPRLSVSVFSNDDVALLYDVGVTLDPGTDANGDNRPLADSTLMVGDTVLLGTRRNLAREIDWRWAGSSPSVAPDSIVVRLPELVAFPMTERTIRLPLPARVGPREFTLVPGQDLPLRLRGVSDSISGLTGVPPSVRWQLEVSEPRRAKRLILNGLGARTDFTVPAALIPTAVGDSLVARLGVIELQLAASAPFPVDVLVQSFITWTIRVVAP